MNRSEISTYGAYKVICLLWKFVYVAIIEDIKEMNMNRWKHFFPLKAALQVIYNIVSSCVNLFKLFKRVTVNIGHTSRMH